MELHQTADQLPTVYLQLLVEGRYWGPAPTIAVLVHSDHNHYYQLDHQSQCPVVLIHQL